MGKKIEMLTDFQKSQMKVYRDKWIEIGLCTDPANRKEAEDGVVEMYKIAGLKPPRIIWCGSPFSMVTDHAIISGTSRVRDSVGIKVRNSVLDSVRAVIAPNVGNRVFCYVGDVIFEAVSDGVGDIFGISRSSFGRASVWTGIREGVRSSVRNSVWDEVGVCGYGQHDASWLAFFGYFSNVVGFDCEAEKLSGLLKVSANAGWYIPCEKICLISERTSLVKKDELSRLHCETGPAVLYPDGWSIYSWHGTQIPSKWIEKKSELTPQMALTWENIEQRRAACEILGWDNVLKVLDAKTIDHDDDPMIGNLVEVDIPNIGKEKFLRVMCGTGREFAIPMPPHIMTALEGNAWSFDIFPDVLKQLEVRT